MRGYLPLIQKGSIAHIDCLAVCMKEGDLAVDNSPGSYLCFQLALPHSMSYFVFLYQSSSSTL